MSPIEHSAWQVWNDMPDQVQVLNPMAEAKHMRFAASMEAFAIAARWHGVDLEGPEGRAVWSHVRMICSMVYEDDYEMGCWHPHAADPQGLLTEYHPECRTCREVFDRG